MSLYMEHETRYQTALNFEEILMNRENVLPIKSIAIQMRKGGVALDRAWKFSFMFYKCSC